MDPSPVAVEVPSERAPLEELFRRLRARAFPVVKAGSRKLAGLVLRRDLVREPDESQVAVLMNPNPFTMYLQAPLREATEALLRSHSPLLPVVSGANDLVGTIAVEACLAELRHHTGQLAPLLRRRVVPVHAATPVRVATHILRITAASALPVLGDDDRLVGIVTDADFLPRLDGRTEAPRRVEDCMVRDVFSVRPTSGVGEAASLMLEHQVHQLPVVDDRGTLLDLLTDFDLAAALL